MAFILLTIKTFFTGILNDNFKKGFIPRGFMDERIESTDRQTNKRKKTDPLKSNADTAVKKASLFSDPVSDETKKNRGSKEKRKEMRELSNKFFLSDFDLEQ